MIALEQFSIRFWLKVFGTVVDDFKWSDSWEAKTLGT
jgi:hypothetical protein